MMSMTVFGFEEGDAQQRLEDISFSGAAHGSEGVALVVEKRPKCDNEEDNNSNEGKMTLETKGPWRRKRTLKEDAKEIKKSRMREKMKFRLGRKFLKKQKIQQNRKMLRRKLSVREQLNQQLTAVINW